MVQVEDKDKEFLFHNDAVTAFNTELYDDIFTEENVTGKKKALTIGDEKLYGYYLEKNNKLYFAVDTYIEHLPFKVMDKVERDYKSDVYYFIKQVMPISIPAEKRMSFRELVDYTPAFQHTNPLHFLLYKILGIAAHVDRFNARVTTDAGFGKDSIVNILAGLVDSTSNIYGATFAKLEFSLMNRLIIFNEMGNLKKDDKANMQEFLLATGAYFNTYTKRTRRTSTTQEQYDVSKLSLLIFYNLPEYYTSRGQEYFDNMFTPAVNNRFMPFVFEGRLTSPFEKVLDPLGIMERNRQLYKDVIATLHYYKDNNVTDIKWNVPEIVKFPEYLKRYERTFYTILKYLSEYSESQEEFDKLVTELYGCYKAYEPLINADAKADDKPETIKPVEIKKQSLLS